MRLRPTLPTLPLPTLPLRTLPTLALAVAALTVAPATPLPTSLLGAPAAAQEATPTPSPCPRLRVDAVSEEGNAATRIGGSIRLRGASSDPSSFYRLEVTYPYLGAVRGGGGTETFWDVRPSENTTLRLRSTVRGQYGCVSDPVALYVEPAVTISAVREAPRDYVFSGRVLPGRSQQVSLYRLDDAGRPVLTARGRVDDQGAYRIPRTFLGSGEFRFFASVPASRTNLTGRSPSRPTVVH